VIPVRTAAINLHGEPGQPVAVIVIAAQTDEALAVIIAAAAVAETTERDEQEQYRHSQSMKRERVVMTASWGLALDGDMSEDIVSSVDASEHMGVFFGAIFIGV